MFFVRVLAFGCGRLKAPCSCGFVVLLLLSRAHSGFAFGFSRVLARVEDKGACWGWFAEGV